MRTGECYELDFEEKMTEQKGIQRYTGLFRNTCYMRRIWAREISFFVSGARDTAHPGSGPAQNCSGLLTFAQAKYHFRHATPQHAELMCFNSSRVGPDLVPYIKMAKIAPPFENERLTFTSYIFSCYLPNSRGLSLSILCPEVNMTTEESWSCIPTSTGTNCWPLPPNRPVSLSRSQTCLYSMRR